MRRAKRQRGGVKGRVGGHGLGEAFSTGAEVEVRSDDDGFRGAWYEATVARRLSLRRFEVAYASLVDDRDPSQPLREAVLSSHLRPRPPPPPALHGVAPSGGAGYGLHDLIEAFHNDGWWAGVITALHHGPDTGRYVVSFPTSREEVEFEASQVRPHLVWVRGHWVPMDEQEAGDATFAVGAQVEVSRSRENDGEAWFNASVTKVLSSSTFLVEYENLKEESNDELLTEIADVQYIRPCQPNLVKEKNFALEKEVEVLLHGGWTRGMILGILDGHRFSVMIMHNGKEMEFNRDEIRHRRYWNGRQWVRKIQDDSRKSPAGSVSGKRKSRAGKRYSLPISLSASSDDGEVTCEPGSTKLCLKRKKAEVQFESSQASKNFKKVKLFFGGPATPTSELNLSAVIPIVEHSSSPMEQHHSDGPSFGGFADTHNVATTVPSNPFSSELFALQISNINGIPELTIREQGLQISNINGIPELPIREEGPPNINEGSERGTKVTQVDGAPFSNEASGIPRLTECKNYEGVRDCTVNVRKRRRKLVIRSRHKKANNDDGLRQRPHDESNKRSRQKHPTKCFSPMWVPIRWEHENSKKSATDEVVSYYRRDKDESSSLDLCVNKSQPLVQQSKVLMLQGPPSIQNIIDSPASDAISIYRVSKQVGYDLCDYLTPQKEPPTAGSSTIKCLIAKSSQFAISSSFKTGTSGDILNNASTENQIIPLVSRGSCTEINQNREPTETVTFQEEVALIDPSSSGSPIKEVLLPFPKTSSMWESIESMEVFQEMPQWPHFRPLEQYSVEFREGMAIGLMVSFANLVASIRQLQVDHTQATLEERLKALGPLEANGFNVCSLHSRLQELLEIQVNRREIKAKKAEFEAKILEKKDDNDRLESLITALDKTIKELKQNLASFRERRDSAIMQKNSNDSEISKLETEMHEAEEARNCSEKNFYATLSSPW